MKDKKENFDSLSFVPTMGNLHRGHISLIDTAKEYKNKVIASIYINKLQFNDSNDYLNYPKTIEDDINILEKHGCDYVLIPDESIIENILNIKAPATPQAIIFFLFCGAKFAAIRPIMIALSAAITMSINMI